MSLKSKMLGGMAAIIGTVVVLAVASTAGFFSPNGTRRADDDREVTLQGIWAPSPRKPTGVRVQIWVASEKRVNEVWDTAPISRSYIVKPGDHVEIWITALDEGLTQAGCRITVDGVEEYTDSRNLYKGRELICNIIIH